jgi:hypothetical protein
MATSTASTQEQSDSKRVKGSATAILHPLDNNNQLTLVFEMLGCGHWLFAGAVSRRWRDLYRQVCADLNSQNPDTEILLAHTMNSNGNL